MTVMAEAAYRFSTPAHQFTVAGLLFDMDGTIVNSIPAVVKFYTE
jgi:hypothetical protein